MPDLSRVAHIGRVCLFDIPLNDRIVSIIFYSCWPVRAEIKFYVIIIILSLLSGISQKSLI